MAAPAVSATAPASRPPSTARRDSSADARTTTADLRDRRGGRERPGAAPCHCPHMPPPPLTSHCCAPAQAASSQLRSPPQASTPPRSAGWDKIQIGWAPPSTWPRGSAWGLRAAGRGRSVAAEGGGRRAETSAALRGTALTSSLGLRRNEGPAAGMRRSRGSAAEVVHLGAYLSGRGRQTFARRRRPRIADRHAPGCSPTAPGAHGGLHSGWFGWWICRRNEQQGGWGSGAPSLTQDHGR